MDIDLAGVFINLASIGVVVKIVLPMACEWRCCVCSQVSCRVSA